MWAAFLLDVRAFHPLFVSVHKGNSLSLFLNMMWEKWKVRSESDAGFLFSENCRALWKTPTNWTEWQSLCSVTSITNVSQLWTQLFIRNAFHTVICLWISPSIPVTVFFCLQLSDLYFCFHHAPHDSRRRMLQLPFTQLTYNRVESLLVIVFLFSVLI